jgi:single-stranded-DNA-specific exonuclease
VPRTWTAPAADGTTVPLDLQVAVGGHPLLARLVALRGLNDASAALAHLDPALYHPASPRELPDMGWAVDLILEARSTGAPVYVWGDLDADGITATAALVEALDRAGLPVRYGLPTRAEGHGLPERAIHEALAAGARLLVTCDTGVGENEMVSGARALGLRVIVTDHHDVPTTPAPADALLNPKVLAPGHPLAELSGVGVAHLLVQALAEAVGPAVRPDEGLDLVALGMVADLARLVDDARYLVQRGIWRIRYTARPGLRAMMGLAGVDAEHADEEDIGYQLGPRLNAAGRLTDPLLGARLLLSHDEDEAAALAAEIEGLNRERRARSEAAVAAAEEIIRRDPELARAPAVWVEGQAWEGGVIGLVASALARRYDRPAIVVAHRADGVSTASARSVEGIDIHAAIVAQSDLLLREGGHPMAAGFSLPRERLGEFRRRLFERVREALAARPAEPPLAIDAALSPDAVTLDLARDLARLGPYGPGNPHPVLAVHGLTVARIEGGAEGPGGVRRLYAADEAGVTLRVTCFGAPALPAEGERIDLAILLRARHWRGRERLEVRLVDWRRAEGPSVAAPATLLGDLEVLDWRADPRPPDELLSDLSVRLGEEVLVWAEGPARPEGSRTRADLAALRAGALAVATAPPDRQTLRETIAAVRPRVLVLLPPGDSPAPDAHAFVQQVAGMLQVALRQHAGRIDTVRMAARVAARPAAIVAALRLLEAEGVITLAYAADGSLLARPAQGGNGAEPARRLEARRVLEALLAETAAFRRAYRTEPPAALLAAPPDG